MPFLATDLKADDLPEGQARCVELGGVQVGLFREADGYFAIDNICPHRGAPLSDGFVSDGYVTCPWHQWQFQLKDGTCRNIPGARVTSYPVEVREGVLFVNVEPAAT
jgi:nitrite reductase (NADH) small subunit/3-phenylpropionate/trans-cinnamate dioxygenase ferredoxin subunit